MSRAHRQEPTGPAPSGLSQSALSQAEPLVPCAATLIDLAVRCEASAGPDRELDKQINAAVSGFTYYHLETPSYRNPPTLTFTASLDAAMTLVPDGADVHIEVKKYSIWAFVGSVGIRAARAATPALALSGAALRFRAASADTRPKGRDGTKIAAPSATSGAVGATSAETPSPSPSPAAGR